MANEPIVLSNVGVPGGTPPSPAPIVAPAPAPVVTPTPEPVVPTLAAPAPTVTPEPTPTPAVTPTPTPTPVVAAWPDDWRTKMAGGDEKALERLKRFADPAAIFTSYRALEAKMSSGDLKAALPKDATPEQRAEYMKANGIPETPAEYLKELPNGIIVGEEDRALAETFAAKMQGALATKEQVAAGLAWYYEFQEATAKEDAAKHATLLRESDDKLRVDWGKDYHENINRVKSFYEQFFPAGIGNLIDQARLPDGTVLGARADVLEAIVALHRDIDPAHSLAPGAAGNTASTVNDEIKKIENVIRTNRREYDRDKSMQDRYLQLIAARDSLAARGRAA